MDPYGLVWAHTSKSRLKVDREFMYIGLAGPDLADGRKAGRADKRAEGAFWSTRTVFMLQK